MKGVLIMPCLSVDSVLKTMSYRLNEMLVYHWLIGHMGLGVNYHIMVRRIHGCCISTNITVVQKPSRQLLISVGNGITGINNALHSRNVTKKFSTIFSDWKVANFLDDSQFAEGQYGYKNEDLNLRPAS